MRTLRILGVVGCVAAFVMAVSAQEREAGPARMQDLLFVSQHTPASSIADVVKEALKGVEGATVVAEPVSNSVLVHAPPEQVARIQGLISGLDAPPSMIELQVVIVRLASAETEQIGEAVLAGDAQEVEASLAALEKAGAVELIERVNLTSLENQIAQVRFGQKVFAPAAVNEAPAAEGRPARGRAAAADEIGTKLTVTARRAGQDVVAELAVDKSWLPPAPRSADDGAAKPPGQTAETLSARATLRLPQGQSVLLGHSEVKDANGHSRAAVIVTARVLAPGEKAGGR